MRRTSFPDTIELCTTGGALAVFEVDTLGLTPILCDDHLIATVAIGMGVCGNVSQVDTAHLVPFHSFVKHGLLFHGHPSLSFPTMGILQVDKFAFSLFLLE
jgi:hypothetical protein